MDTPYATLTLARVTSTQDVAREAFLERGEAVLVVADRQTEGRGRSGRAWMQAPQSLAASLAVEIDWPADRLPTVPLVAGVALFDALAVVTDATLTLKWPNDVLAGADKLAGILVERFGELVVVGCGANLCWPDRPDGIAALHDAPVARGEATRLAESWADGFLARLARGPDHWGREEYEAHCITLGSEVTWHPAGAGRAVGIGPDGSLLVESRGVRSAIHSGEVHVVRPANVAPHTETGDEKSTA